MKLEVHTGLGSVLLLEDKGRRETEEVKKNPKNKNRTITKGVRSCALLRTPKKKKKKKKKKKTKY